MTTTKEVTFKSIINGLSLPTLEDISIVALAIRLMEEKETKKICCQHFCGKSVRYSLTRNKISKLTSVCKLLELPEIIEAKVVSVFHWIRRQYFDWIRFVTENLPQLEEAFPQKSDYINHIMNSVRWSNGVINQAKSMHLVFCDVEDDENLIAIFKMASRFCLVDDLKIVWGKMSDEAKKRAYLGRFNSICYFSLYWTCRMRGDKKEFRKNIHGYLKDRNCYAAVRDHNSSNYALILNIYEGDISGMKYFYKLAGADVTDVVHILKIVLRHKNGLANHRSADKLLFLLREIKDEGILKEIFHEFFEVFLKISIEYWPWHKFFLTLSRMCVDRIDQVLFYDLIAKLMEDVENEKVDVVQVKMLWKDTPRKLKKSFCSYISNKQKLRNVKDLWRTMTVEIFEMFLKDEEIRNILTPYENYGILEFIYTGRYDLIEFWLQKCLGSEDAIFSYLQNFIETKSVAVIKTLQRFPLSRVNEFLDWAFKYEDLMDKPKILKWKDEAINQDIVAMFVRGMRLKRWEDLEKIIDWMVRRRNNKYENALVSWKEKAVKEFFRKPNITLLNSNDFKNSFFNFLKYGVNDSEKIKVMMSKVNVSEGDNCFGHLKADFNWIDDYLKILEKYGKDILLTKNNIFYYVFNDLKETDFLDVKFCENIRKLLFWNCESDEEMTKKVKKIKKGIIDKYALKIVLNCVSKKWDVAMNNILKFFFEDKEEMAQMLFELKLKVVLQKSDNEDSDDDDDNDAWKKKDYFDMMEMLINWGKENKTIRKRNWKIKKSFIGRLKKNLKVETIPKLILDWNFVPTFLEGDEANDDFENTLWDLKEFLLKKLISEDDYRLISCELFENFEDFTDFLNWNGFDEAKIAELKTKILDEKGVRCCLSWISTDKLNALSSFLNWCIAKNSSCDLKPKIQKLKEDVLDNVICKSFDNWTEEYFQRLDKFLLMHCSVKEKNLKEMIVKKNAVKRCIVCLFGKNLDQLKAFMKWAGINDEENIENFKRNILKEILKERYVSRWKDSRYMWKNELEFRQILDMFLYDYGDPDPVKIANMKLDLLEVRFFAFFKKLIGQKDTCNLIRFLKWSFDKHVKSGKCLVRAKKLIKEMFEKFGKGYCVVMLMAGNINSVTYFWNLCFDSEADSDSEFWDFKKDCINQLWTNYIEKGEYCWSMKLDRTPDDISRFISSGPGSSSLEEEISEYKDYVAQKYGIAIMEKYLQCMIRNSSLNIPKNFLTWLFGVKNQESQTNLDEKKLYDFKKQMLERLINIKHQDNLMKDSFYLVLENFLKFNSTPSSLDETNDLIKSACELQGIELCISLMCKNDSAVLQRFLRWVYSFYDNFVDFKHAVILQLAANLMRVYSWDSLKFFLQDGFDLNNENEKEKYSTLKKFVCDSCSADICYNWILNNQWDEIIYFLAWAFGGSDCKELKLELIKKHGAEYCNARILEDDWEKLKKFLDWAFGSHEKNNEREEKIINLKIESLSSSEICYKNHSEILLMFLEWGFNSEANLNKFKKSILNKSHPLNYFVKKQKYKTQKQFQLWFVNKK